MYANVSSCVCVDILYLLTFISVYRCLFGLVVWFFFWGVIWVNKRILQVFWTDSIRERNEFNIKLNLCFLYSFLNKFKWPIWKIPHTQMKHDVLLINTPVHVHIEICVAVICLSCFRHEFISWFERWMYHYCERVMSFWNGFWLVVDLACQRHVCRHCWPDFSDISDFILKRERKVPCTVWTELKWI